MSHSYSKAFIKDNSIAIIGHVLVYMKGLILMPIIIQAVGVKIYGGFVLFSLVLDIVFGVSSLGVGFSAKRFLPSANSRDARNNLFYPQLIFWFFSILFFSFLLLILNKYLQAYVYKNEISYSIYIIPAYLVAYMLYSEGCDYLRYTSRISFMIVANVLFPYIFIGILLLFIFWYNNISINTIVLLQSLSAILIAVPCFLLIFKEIGLRPSFYSIKTLAFDIKLGFPLLLSFIVEYILVASSRYLIALYLTVSAVGYYTPGYVLGSLIILIPRAMGNALPQLLSRAVDSENEIKAQVMVNYAIKSFLLLAIPYVFGSILFGKSILEVLANREVAENAYLVTPIVSLGMVFYGLNLILSNILFVRMKTYVMFKMNIFAAFFNLVSNMILLFFYRSIIVAAVTTFLSYFIVFIYLIVIIRSHWNISFQHDVILKALISSLFMGIILYGILFKTGCYNSIALLVFNVILGIVIYFISLFALKAFTRKEINYMKMLITQRTGASHP